MTKPLRRGVTFLLATLAGSTGAGPAFAAANAFRILHHETLKIEASEEPGAGERVSFEAYGRRFDLRLAPNERVQRAVGGIAASSVALEGTVDGESRSWVRLTRSAGGRWHGMFSDGRDVYAVEPVEDVSEALVQPADSRGAAPVIFRLADALLPVGAAHCGTVTIGHQASALEAYKSVATQVESQSVASSPTKRLVVGVVADHEFASFFATNGNATAEEAIVQRMNVVDGIFAAQLGVKIELAPPTVFRNEDDPFSRTNANELLDELRRYRAGSGPEMSRGITHLMTGRDMDGETVGIAYLGSVCGGGVASSLSEGTRSTTSAALVAAHEIGHNFDAPHDGDTGAACASTPQSFLMAPRLNGSQQFSSCSIDQMARLATSGWCLADIAGPVAAPDPPPGEPRPPGGNGTANPEGSGGGGPIGPVLLGLLALALARRARGFNGRVRPRGVRASRARRGTSLRC